ncbi:MAG TPA: DUF58 domain-containing protein [Rhizomicrobium sp.]|jgi:uncharacterized protein (DUF58 family)
MTASLYPSARSVFLVGVGVPLALILGVMAPGLWLAGIAWSIFALGVILLDAMATCTPSSLRVVAHLPDTIAMGTQPIVHIDLQFTGRLVPASAEVALDTSPQLDVAPARQTVPAAGVANTAAFAVVPWRRGEGRFERLWIRWPSPLGLVWRQRLEEIGRNVPIIPNLQGVKEEALRLFRREAPFGLNHLLDSGDSAEFHALRDFQPGMDRRRIDWKQSAKHGALVAKQFQAETNQHIVLALDTGRLMSEPLDGQPRLDRALHAVLLIAYVALRLGDRVGLFAFDEKPRLASGTVAGAQAFPLLQRLASALDYSTAETNFTLGLTQLGSDLERRSTVVIFTDFVDTTSAELMLENVGRLLARHVVLFVVFRDQELEGLRNAEPRSPEDVSRAVVADALLRERNIVIERLRRLGANIVDAPVSRIGMKLLATYLSSKRLGGY